MVPKCYAGKLLYINLNNKLTADIPLDEKFYEEFIGGKGIATKFLTDYVMPTADPFSDMNALIIMSGALNPYFPKFTVTSKSPLTNTICTSNCGGSFGSMIKKAGYDGLIIQGKAKNLTCLRINGEDVFFDDAKDLKLNLISEAEKKLPKKYSKLIIGPAGENMVNYASITSDNRFAGRGGLGAVMGSKNLKAIIVKGDKEYELSEEFKEFCKKANKEWAEHARVQNLKKYGTANLILPGAIFGYTPVENYKKPSKNDLEKFENISGEEFAKDVVGNMSCKRCPISCGKKMKLENKIVKRPEYESIAFLGPNLRNYDKQSIARLNHLCDDLGLDTISTGAVLGYAMETGSFPLAFGINQNLEEVVKKIAYKEDYGIELSKGVKKISELCGKKLRAMHVKGLEIAAYIPDGRTLAQTLGYLVNPRGACHLNAPTALDELTLFAPLEPYDIKGKPELVAFLEDLDNVMDSMGVCRFTAYAFIKKGFKMPHKVESMIFRNLPKFAMSSTDISTYYKLLSKATGKKFDKKKILNIGEKISKLELEFNKKAGRNIEDETLPEDMLKNLTKEGDVKKGADLLKKMLCKYAKIRNMSS